MSGGDWGCVDQEGGTCLEADETACEVGRPASLSDSSFGLDLGTKKGIDLVREG